MLIMSSFFFMYDQSMVFKFLKSLICSIKHVTFNEKVNQYLIVYNILQIKNIILPSSFKSSKNKATVHTNTYKRCINIADILKHSHKHNLATKKEVNKT